MSKMPTVMSQESLAKALFESLKDISLEDLVKLLTNETEEIIQYYDLTRGGKTCKKMSLLFNPHRLDTKAKGSRDTIYGALKNMWYAKGLARALIFKNGHYTYGEMLYQVFQLGINGVQYINEFPPHVAVELCRRYISKTQKDNKVLDPCGGWGGRMIGASVVVNSYTCFEPETRTASGLRKLSEFIRDKGLNPNFHAEVFCLPFEDSELKPDYYDFALTSPPYYDTEEYSTEETNSLNRYKTFDSWCEGFYLPMIEKTMAALKPGASFVLNIGDRRYPLSKILLENFSNKPDYQIEKLKSRLSSCSGIGKSEGSGESFYRITKSQSKIVNNQLGFFQ